MAYPYKKMTEEDFSQIRSFTSADRVWVGEEIAGEYYHDEMPEYGSYPPELYVEVINKEEVSSIMAYAYKENIPAGSRRNNRFHRRKCHHQRRRHESRPLRADPRLCALH